MKKRVLLTHSQGRLEGLVELLSEYGVEIEHQPLIQTTVIEDSTLFKQAEALLTCEWMLFTSQAAIDAWLELDVGFPKRMRYGAVGRKTSIRLKALGIEAEVIGEPQDAQGLADVFIQNHPDAKSVALPKGNLSLSILDNSLKLAAIEVKPLVIYEVKTVNIEHLQDELFDVVFFASPSAVEAFSLANRKETNFVAIGKTTAKAIHDSGLHSTIRCTTAETPTIEAIAEAIVKVLEQD